MAKKKNIILIGAGGHSESCIDLLNEQSVFRLKEIVGKKYIINSNALIEHGCSIGDHSHISTSATVNSGVVIGEQCFVGSNSVIKQSLKIKKKSFIKMGSIIKKNR